MSQITFARLGDIAPQTLCDHMNDPRVAAHLPLLTRRWDLGDARAFVAAKEACWQRDGLGHWAFLCGPTYLGWGGFQKEGPDWDFGLVLHPDRFGMGPRILRQALAFARDDARIAQVMFLLPPSRRHLGALDRLGAQPRGRVTHDGAEFLKFTLETG
ncbi:GNAT family protein [Actibacterium ureilyticum]|uniref:GNAT family protein n=1 Tax=Actibacterium ureilyticum TaxID=1590614 RepID=UPI000BAAC7F7|nr:GNAT family protein [Actibacterium ureilyticum]